MPIIMPYNSSFKTHAQASSFKFNFINNYLPHIQFYEEQPIPYIAYTYDLDGNFNYKFLFVDNRVSNWF